MHTPLSASIRTRRLPASLDHVRGKGPRIVRAGSKGLRLRPHSAQILVRHRERPPRVDPRIDVIGADLAGRLPLFDPDVENDEDAWPEAVRAFRAAADRAEGVVIATPEYAHGPSGATKNALDWLVGSGGLMGKPILLTSASPGQAGGMRAHTPLMPTLTLLGAILVDCVVISRAGARVDAQGEYVDPAVVERMRIAVAEPADALEYASTKRSLNPEGLM